MGIVDGIGDEVTFFFLGFLVTIVIGLAWFPTNYSQQPQFQSDYLLDLGCVRRFLNHIFSFRRESVINNEVNEEEEVESLRTDELSPDIVVNQEQTAIPTTIAVRNPQRERPKRKLCIKLIFLNDNVCQVVAEPSEKLGDFRQRLFATEMLENKLVRFIFQGRILHEDTCTLENCGMFNKCVVHCLIQNQRMIRTFQEESGDTIYVMVQRELANLWTASVGFSTALFWYIRLQYPYLFTVIATVGLMILGVVIEMITEFCIPGFQRVHEWIGRQGEAVQRRPNYEYI